MEDWCGRLESDGFALLRGVFSREEMGAAAASCEAALAGPAAAGSLLARDGGRPHGARNLLRLWPGAAALARSRTLLEPLTRVLGAGAGLVRALYFDKPPGDSWALPWHRDTTVAVRCHGRLGLFLKPTVKAGVPHVEAPAALLASMLAARVHLDDVTDHNGPLRVVPGSHRANDGDGDIGREPVTVRCGAGDVLLMRPLLLHASGHCAAGFGGHRRIVHLELAPGPHLPDGYEWHDYIGLRSGDAGP